VPYRPLLGRETRLLCSGVNNSPQIGVNGSGRLL
jgi:hypothetical protein